MMTDVNDEISDTIISKEEAKARVLRLSGRLHLPASTVDSPERMAREIVMPSLRSPGASGLERDINNFNNSSNMNPNSNSNYYYSYSSSSSNVDTNQTQTHNNQSNNQSNNTSQSQSQSAHSMEVQSLRKRAQELSTQLGVEVALDLDGCYTGTGNGSGNGTGKGKREGKGDPDAVPFNDVMKIISARAGTKWYCCLQRYGFYLYIIVISDRFEWCIWKPWSSFIISYSSTSIVYYHNY